MKNIPKFAYWVMSCALLSLILTSAIAFHVVSVGRHEDQRDCQRSVDYRNDNRTMWLYLINKAAPGKEEQIAAFTKELDKRLPQLECVDQNAVPVTNS